MKLLKGDSLPLDHLSELPNGGRVERKHWGTSRHFLREFADFFLARFVVIEWVTGLLRIYTSSQSWLQACFARIQDCQRKFFEAATRYYELSQLVADDEQTAELALQSATVCTILSPAGPKRSR